MGKVLCQRTMGFAHVPGKGDKAAFQLHAEPWNDSVSTVQSERGSTSLRLRPPEGCVLLICEISEAGDLVLELLELFSICRDFSGSRYVRGVYMRVLKLFFL